MTPLAVAGVPFPMTPSVAGRWIAADTTGELSVTADPHSDIFIDPGSVSQPDVEPPLNALTLLGVPPPGDFQLSARVTVDFGSMFDAGVLLLWVDERHWAKLCFEYSPDRQPMVVSVVCRDVADDANAFVTHQGTVWLRVSRVDLAFAFHASLDGTTWQLVRFFTVADPSASATIGFEAQSPTGEGCAVTFDEIRFSRARLADLRDGS